MAQSDGSRWAFLDRNWRVSVLDPLPAWHLTPHQSHSHLPQEAQGRGFRGEALSSGYQSAMAACAAEEKWGVVHGLFEEMQKEMTADVESYRLAMEASHGLKCPGNTIELLRSAEEQLGIQG